MRVRVDFCKVMVRTDVVEKLTSRRNSSSGFNTWRSTLSEAGGGRSVVFIMNVDYIQS